MHLTVIDQSTIHLWSHHGGSIGGALDATARREPVAIAWNDESNM
jgi:hypothetical protein